MDHPGPQPPPTPPPPKDVGRFLDWVERHHQVDLRSLRERTAYEGRVRVAQNAIEDAPFFSRLGAVLDYCATRYRDAFGGPLLSPSGTTLDLKTKPYDSVLDKIYRLNTVWNKNYPDPPRNGWVLTDTLFSKVDDLVRGTLVCQFMDGPEWLGRRLVKTANKVQLAARGARRHLFDGYYAYHVYIDVPVPVIGMVTCEIQLTTVFQFMLRDYTHGFYSQNRSRGERDDAWKWDHRSPRFRASYLSHTLHFIEAAIVDLRNEHLEQGAKS